GDGVEDAEKVRVERRLIEDVVADPVAARDPPRPLVVRSRIARQHGEERRAADLPDVREAHDERDGEDREIAQQGRYASAGMAATTRASAQTATKSRNHETTKRETNSSSWFRGFVISWLTPVILVCAPSSVRAQPRLTFTKDIAPIVWTRCASCHRPGAIGPFSLLTYDDVKRRATLIADVTSRRLMPPWKPLPGKGEFEGARRLTDDELQRIQQWIAEGAPEGDAADRPPRPTFIEEASGWQLGAPDLVVAMPEPYNLRADPGDVFRTFVIPIPLTG